MKILFTEKAQKDFSKLDKTIQLRIKKCMDEVSLLDNPRARGKGLRENLSGLWRYRVGEYRIICRIEEEKLIVLVVSLGHRKEVYIQ